MEQYSSREEYEAALTARAILPEGFRAASVALTFRPAERDVAAPLPMNLTAIVADKPSSAFAALFTRNAFPGAPVLIGRERLADPAQPPVSGFLINNKVANVGAPQGRADAERVLAAWAPLLGTEARAWFPCSTGVIGWSLPVQAMSAALPALRDALQAETLLPAAKGIMTTDAFPKVRARLLSGGARITAMAKGAGMIEPNMATMLVYILTDADLPRAVLQSALTETAAVSFNALSVDGDQSTSDSAFLLSSGLKAAEEAEFRAALEELCVELAQDIVRNGEGTKHLIEMTVSGMPDAAVARGAAKAVVNSPLVKSAVFGNDPNVGRLLGALGDYLGNRAAEGGAAVSMDRLRLVLNGEVLFEKGRFSLDPQKENRVSAILRDAQFDNGTGFPPHSKKVILEADFGYGGASARVWGSDLSYDYVRENADYRT